MAIESTENGHGLGAAASMLGNLNVEDAQQMLEQGRAALDQAVESAETFIRERPIVCLAGALAIGYLIGKIVSR